MSTVLTSRLTGTGALASSVNFERDIWLDEIRIALNAAGAGNLTIIINRAAGAAYDYLYDTINTAVTQYKQELPTRPMFLFNGDTIDFAWTNSTSKTYGIEVFARPA